MDEANEAMSHIRRGCQLAKELQERIAYLGNEPHSLSSLCVEITNSFQKAINLLSSSSSSPFERQRMILRGESSRSDDILMGISQTMDFFQPQALAVSSQFDATSMGALEVPRGFPCAPRMMDYVGGGGDSESLPRSAASSEFRVGDGGDAGTSAQGGAFSAGRSSRSRKEAGEKRVVRMPAPKEGNLETPPDDGFTWRKYGQKEILNSKYPRGYFRCTHRNFYGCEAKKQVQRLDDDPFTFEVTYRGHHTCQTSNTPLLIPNSQPHQAMLITPQDSPVSTSIALSSWVSSQLEGGEKERAAERNIPVEAQQMQSPYGVYPGMGESSNVFGESSSRGGGGKEREGSPVEEYAKFMFSSGSSSDNMDLIFSAKKGD